jgi:hypothetical protein
VTSLALFVILAGARAQNANDFWVLLFNSAFFTSIGPMLYIFALYATAYPISTCRSAPSANESSARS